MADYRGLTETIRKRAGNSTFAPASPSDLAELRTLKLPVCILDFYARYEPHKCEMNSIRLHSIEDILIENRDAVPGYCILPFGYVVFASNGCGDAYCFNLNNCDPQTGEPRIVLISHEPVDEDTITAAEAARLAKPIARDFEEFLGQFIRGDVDEDCIY